MKWETSLQRGREHSETQKSLTERIALTSFQFILEIEIEISISIF